MTAIIFLTVLLQNAPITDAIAHERAIKAIGPDARTHSSTQTLPNGKTEVMHCIGLQRYQSGTIKTPFGERPHPFAGKPTYIQDFVCAPDWERAIENIEHSAEAIKRTEAMANLPKKGQSVPPKHKKFLGIF